MPNLHWFGTEIDNKNILSDVLLMPEIQIFELSSPMGENIRTFDTTEQIIAEFQKPYENGEDRRALNLNFWVIGSGPKPTIERVSLNPESCNGHTWRERSGAVGFVQFYIERQSGRKLMHSRTNTVSEARMGAVEGHHTGHDGVIWNVQIANRASNKINRLIRKKAVAKIGSMVVLPDAARFWETGGCLGYCSKSLNPERYVPLT